jgi:hypothetical protein
LKLNIIDTPGYGDQINNDNCWDPIVKYASSAALIARAKLTCRSKISTPPTYEKNLQPCEIDISPIPVSTVVYSSSTPLDIP